MPNSYVPPQLNEDGFNCPHCEAYAQQHWQDITWSYRGQHGYSNPYDAQINRCERCKEYGFWIDSQLIYPKESPAPLPSEDMPEEVERHFREARKVVSDSPRAAAAILRLAMETLAEDLTGKENQSLYQNIGELLDEGRIDERMQQALDSVRVFGNDYVHAGEITEEDDAETALRLFDLVNVIVEITISRDRLIDESYSSIPENKLEGIQQRDDK